MLNAGQLAADGRLHFLTYGSGDNMVSVPADAF